MRPVRQVFASKHRLQAGVTAREESVTKSAKNTAFMSVVLAAKLD
jgi:hypothetical protein